jgi:integrase
MAGIVRRSNVFHIRIKIPRDLQSRLGCNEVWRSLKTGEKKIAKLRASQFYIECHIYFDALRSGTWSPLRAAPWEAQADQRTTSPSPPVQSPAVTEVPALTNQSVVQWTGRQKQLQTQTSLTSQPNIVTGIDNAVGCPPISVGELVSLYLAEKSDGWSYGTLYGYRIVLRAIEELIGSQTLMGRVTRDDLRKLMKILSDLPANYMKIKALKGKSFREIAELAPTLGVKPRKSTTTNSYMTNVSSIFGFAMEEGYIQKNIAKGLRMPQKKRSIISPRQLSPEMLTWIAHHLSSNAEREKKFKDSSLWIFMLALFQGMRLNEICQLSPGDIGAEENVFCIRVAVDLESRSWTKAKNEHSRRIIPVHPRVLDSGFIAFVRTRSRDADFLFDGIEVGSKGYCSEAFGKWFSRQLRESPHFKEGQSFHGLRHEFRDATRRARLTRDEYRSLGGWASQEVADDYGRGVPVSQMLDALKKIDFPYVNLSSAEQYLKRKYVRA